MPAAPYPGTLVRLANGGFFGLREVARTTGADATIDVNIRGFRDVLTEITFLP